jgi:Bacterial TSP3 repeat
MVRAMGARMREQRGQISVEWVGVLAVFCALVAALLALHLGGPLSNAVDHTVCSVGSIGKGDCGKDPSPTSPEPTASKSKSENKGATAAKTTDDPDGDGLSTARERALGLLPGKADSDGDGVTDGDELRHHTNPKKADSDGDGVDDGTALRDKAADG